MDNGDAKIMNNIQQIKEDIAGLNIKSTMINEEPKQHLPNLHHTENNTREVESDDDYPTLPPPPSIVHVTGTGLGKNEDHVLNFASSIEQVSLTTNLDTQDSKGCWYVKLKSKRSRPYSSGDNEKTGAVMPVHMDSEIYNMNHPKRGRAIIFNHEYFNPQLELSRRQGTEKDKLNLKQTLKNIGFEVTHHDDLTYHEIVHQIEALTKEDHQDRDCLLIAVLSHGDAHLMYAKDYSYKPDMLWSSFTADRVPSLAGKPKLFFIQACQGSQLDDGTRLVRVSRTEVDSQPPSYRIPNHADFLIAYSTFPGHYAWRNTTNGSWFIQAICSVFSKYACKKDLLSMMTIVCREVALHYESNTPSIPHMHQKKQCPFVTSTLTREIFLPPK